MCDFVEGTPLPPFQNYALKILTTILKNLNPPIIQMPHYFSGTLPSASTSTSASFTAFPRRLGLKMSTHGTCGNFAGKKRRDLRMKGTPDDPWHIFLTLITHAHPSSAGVLIASTPPKV